MMAKKLWKLTSILVLAAFLTACGGNGNNDDTTDNAAGDNNNQEELEDANEEETNSMNEDESKQNNDTVEKTDSDKDMIDKMDKLDYSAFEIEADYSKNNEYEAEIEQNQDKGTIESEVDNEVKNNEDIKGEEAFDKIYPMVEKLTIDQDTSKEDAIVETLNAFDLDSDYNKLEIEITFNDGTKLEYEDK